MATLTERLAEIRAQATTIVDVADSEGRPLNADEQARFDALVEQGAPLRNAIEAQVAARNALDDMATDSPAPRATTTGGRPSSLGQRFIDSPVMQNLRRQYPNGIPSGTKVETGSVNLGRISNALLTDPGLTPPLHVIDAPTGVAVMTLMDAITVIDDAPPTIKHYTAAFTNAAAVVAEGVAKPEATLTWTPVTLNQEVVAHWIPVTNQSLSHNALMRGIIDAFLVNGVRARVQTEIATDLAAWAGLGTQAFSTDLRTTLRRAVTKAQTAGAIIGAGPISIVISATDAETLDLEQLANIVLSPGEMPQQGNNIWRAPLIVVASGLASGFAYVGDLKQVVWYTSGDVNVSVGTTGTQFIENERTILAETEGITGVVGAAAIIKADLTA
ncbi:MAG: phage major capsid protein [Microthrixaceae bacterium]|nr:phage major capsid protein [Microthrixaceae bacterium]